MQQPRLLTLMRKMMLGDGEMTMITWNIQKIHSANQPGHPSVESAAIPVPVITGVNVNSH